MYRIAVIGDADSVLGFQTLGLEVCPVNSADEARQAIHRMARENYAILYLTEQLAAQLKSEVEFIGLSSYQNATKSSGVVNLEKDLSVSIKGRDVLIVEDIVDSGNTLFYLGKYLMGRGASSIRIATLLDKPDRRNPEHNLTVDYHCFKIPDEFVVGYGLDFAEKYRNLPDIGVLDSRVYGAAHE